MKNTEIKIIFLMAILLAFIAVSGIIKRAKLKRNLSDLQAKYEQLLNAPKDTIRITMIDTLTEVKPMYIDRYISEVDSVFIHDTIHHTIYNVPREFVRYEGEDYKAVVSGVSPRLDTIQIFAKTITTEITKHIEHTKYKRFGVGVGVGASYDGKKVRPAISVGVQYNLISF